MRESNPCTGWQWEMGSVPPHRESRARYPRSIVKGRPAGGGPSHLFGTCNQRYWRLAAVLFVGGGLAAFPTDALRRPSAGELAERLQQAIAKLTVEGRPLGATTGHAVYPQDAESLNTLLAHADEVLRASKDPRGR